MLNHYLLDPDPELYFRIWFWIRGKVSDPDPQHWTFSEAGADPKWSGSPTLAKCTCLLCLFWILIHGLSCFGSVFLFLIRIQWLNSSVADPDIGRIRIFFPDPDPDAAKSERAYILNCVFLSVLVTFYYWTVVLIREVQIVVIIFLFDCI